MSKKILLLGCFCISMLTFAQKKDKTAMKFAETITAGELRTHLYKVASKEMEGRNTPSVGLDRAAAYIENHFRTLGLKPGNNGSYLQKYPLYKDSTISAGMEINNKALEINTDFQPQANNYKAEMRFSEVVFAGYGISDATVRDDYQGLNVAGKLVMILDGTPADYKPSQTAGRGASVFGKMNTAMSKGATGLLIVYSNFPRKEASNFSNWTMNSFRGTQPPFTFSISTATAKKIMNEDADALMDKAKAATLPGKTYKADIALSFNKETQVAYAANVIGVIEGTDLKDEYVFITAHYDHLGMRGDVIYYGADDDGSGTVGVLELADAFAKAKYAGKGPRRSIVLMTVSGEEKGLWGSAYYANHPIFPLEKTTVDLNIDMIGRSDDTRKGDTMNYVYVVGDDKLSTDLKPISEAVNKLYTKLELDYKFNDPNDRNRIYYRSDHYNFADKGVPIIFYYDGMLGSDYHKPTDTPDKIHYELLQKRAQLVFYTAWEMANRKTMLKRDLKLDVPGR